MLKKITKIIYALTTGILIAIAILLVISVLPITGNYKVLAVLSGSMEPEIKTGSVVIVKPAPFYQIGDVITFSVAKKNKIPTTHRIVEINNNFYTTKGDANNASDSQKISEQKIIGKVLFSVPFVGYAIEAAKKPFGFILIIVLPALAIIFDEIKKIFKEAKRLKLKKKIEKENNAD